MGDVVNISQKRAVGVRLVQPVSAQDIGRTLKGKRVGDLGRIGEWQGYGVRGEAWKCRCPICNGVLLVEDVAIGEVRLDCASGCAQTAAAAQIAGREVGWVG